MNTVSLNMDLRMPNMTTAFGWALGVHVAMFLWNPTVLNGHLGQQAPPTIRVEFRDSLPTPPPPPPPKIEKKPVPKAKKSGLMMHQQAPAPIRAVKHLPKAVVPRPAPRSRASAVKMPKFIPHAVDEDRLMAAAPREKLATTTALRPASNPFSAPQKLTSKSRGVRAGDIQFKLEDRGTPIAGGGAVVNIPIGEERGEVAMVGAPTIHDAPLGRRRTSGFYPKPGTGDGIGELTGKNRMGYVASIQVGMPSDEQVIAAGNQHGSSGTVGNGFEIGGPVGDRKVLRRHLPEYPAWAEEKGVSALVKIFFTVKSDGTIRRSVRIVHSSGYTELDSLAKEALLAWKFSPTQATSSTDEAWGVITFKFTLA